MFRILLIVFLLVFIFLSGKISAWAKNELDLKDSLLILKNYNTADSLLQLNNSTEATRYFLQTIQYALPYYLIYKKYDQIIFRSIENVNNYYVASGKQTYFIAVISNLFPYINDAGFKSMVLKIFLESASNFLENNTYRHLISNVINDLRNNKDYNQLGRLFLSIGNSYYNNGDFKSALKYYQLTYNIFKKIGDEVGLSKALNNYSIILIELKSFIEAERLLNESLHLKEKHRDEAGKAFVYNNLSMIYSEIAIDYLNKNKDSANYYKEKALYFSRLSIKVDSLFNKQDGIMTSLLNEASLLLDFGEYLNAQKRYDIIKEYTEKNPDAFELRLYYLINSSDFDILMAEKAALSETQMFYYLQQARQKLIEAKNISEKFGYEHYLKEIYSQLYILNKRLGNFKDALIYLELNIAYKDSLLNIEKINYISKLDKQFHAKQQREKIQYLEKERQWLNNQRNLILLFGTILAVLSIIIIYQIYKRLITSRRQNEIILKQKSSIEQINKELKKKNTIIEQSLAYTKTIQMSFLISELELKKHFTQAFIIYLPKEQLSGDFYVYKQINQNIYLVLGDCAGHGIPGAVMSFVACSFLFQLFSTNENLQPDKILNILHQKMLEFQMQRSSDLTESTEISVCQICKETKTVTISSTNQVVYVVLDDLFIAVDPDIQSIGQFIGDELSMYVQFTKHTFVYNDRCRIFMSTDGFYDEYNTSVKKRYGQKQFAEFLERRKFLPLQAIKEDLILEHYKWNNKTYQIDDITVLGVEV